MKKLSRHELIKTSLEEHTMALLKSKQIKGVTTIILSKELSLLRNNVSMELNNLVKLGNAIKIKGKPVEYFSKMILLEFYPNHVFKSIYNNISDFLLDVENNPSSYISDKNDFNQNTINTLPVNSSKKIVLTPPRKDKCKSRYFF